MIIHANPIKHTHTINNERERDRGNGTHGMGLPLAKRKCARQSPATAELAKLVEEGDKGCRRTRRSSPERGAWPRQWPRGCAVEGEDALVVLRGCSRQGCRDAATVKRRMGWELVPGVAVASEA